MVEQDEIHRMARSKNVEERQIAIYKIRDTFSILDDKKQAWEDLIWLIEYETDYVRRGAAYALGMAYPHIPNKQKQQAWNDLICLTQKKDDNVRRGAAYALSTAYSYVLEENKQLAWQDLHQLIKHENDVVRKGVANTLGAAYSNIPNEHKQQVWDDLIRLTLDKYGSVRASAYNSMGKASIFKAAGSENKDDLKKYLEEAIRYFENSSQQMTQSNPAAFCLPFYRSFYMLAFKKEKAEAEVEKYLSEAKSAVGGSESREKLLEAVDNLGNALKEVQNLRNEDLDTMKFDLNSYRRYCERASELLEITDEKAPGATRLIKKGFPIIDEQIKGILVEIQEKATALCRQTKGTPFQTLGKEVNQIGKTFLQIKDPIGLEKSVGNMMIALSQICAELPERERGNACELLNKAKEEPYVDDKLDLINMVLSKIPPQIGGMNKTIIVNQYGNGDRFYNESLDKSINIAGDLTADLETLSALIKRDYSQDDRNEVIQTVKQMKQSCNDPSKKNWLKEKIRWLVTRTSDVPSISSFSLELLDKVK